MSMPLLLGEEARGEEPGARELEGGVPAVPDALVSGIVVDASGAPIAGARVVIETETGRHEVRTRADGRFTVEQQGAGPASLAVEASGFARATLRVGAPASTLHLRLHPAPLSETITVTASRGLGRLETAAPVTALSAAEVLNAPAPTVDDTLRTTPGFSLFRRSSSRVANPSTQGVTLRGVSGTGASRTLVLADGLPLNDPFGSWVYWNRVPIAAIERVEVARGAAGDLHGNDALGGTVQLLTFDPGAARVRAVVEGGSHETLRASVFASERMGRFTGAVAGEALATAGVFVTAPAERGPADSRAGSDYRSGLAAVGYDDGAWRAQVRVAGFGEERDNGTRLVGNDTRWRQLSAEAAGPLAGGHLRVRAAAADQRYWNSFSAVSEDRSSERVTREQGIPSESALAGLEWARPIGPHVFLVGGEGRTTRATVEETRHGPTDTSGPFLSGGRESIGALFARASLAAGTRARIAAGARAELWRSDPRDAGAPRHQVSFLSPRLALSWRATDAVMLAASASRAYRAPTLNELHRGFRVGNVVTEGNALLDPERLTGLDVAALLSWPALSLRATAFWSRLDDAITNVTLGATPALITRQKQNAQRTRAAGVELELVARPHARLQVSALAGRTDSVFDCTPDQPDLVGRSVPQVAGYQVGAIAAYSGPRESASVQLRVLGPQYDDDLNAFRLRAFAVLDASATRSIGRGLHGFVAVENLLDSEYDVARTPQRQIGWPRTVRLGLRFFRP